jgi:hypothetical protein
MLARTGVAVSGLVAMVAVVTAAATIWLLLTNPAGVADAVASQGGPALVRALADAVVSALQQIARWL